MAVSRYKTLRLSNPVFWFGCCSKKFGDEEEKWHEACRGDLKLDKDEKSRIEGCIYGHQAVLHIEFKLRRDPFFLSLSFLDSVNNEPNSVGGVLLRVLLQKTNPIPKSQIPSLTFKGKKERERDDGTTTHNFSHLKCQLKRKEKTFHDLLWPSMTFYDFLWLNVYCQAMV